MRTNVKRSVYSPSVPAFTHNGAPSALKTPLQELTRTVMANMLFENTFYESGVSAADRIKQLVKQVTFEEAARVAVDARLHMKLRHVPLLILRELLRGQHGRKMGDLIETVIQRPDEMGELLSLYRADGGKSEPNQLKIGLARALKKFDEYQLAKWKGEGNEVSLRDILFLSHPRPKDDKQQAIFNKIAQGNLSTPDTWETNLSGGADKKETFTRLITENKLGALALLRNLRGMQEAGVSSEVIRQGIQKMKVDRVLPFRFLSAAKYAPGYEADLEQAMFKCLAVHPKLKGKTAILIDHSGSMDCSVSSQSDINRFDTACAVGMLLREIADECRVFTFANHTVEVPNRRGFALKDAVKNSMPWGGTQLGQAVRFVYNAYPNCERLIVITDEQSSDRPAQPNGRGYIVNVAPYKNGIGYGSWVTVDGWSEAIIDFIQEYERIEDQSLIQF